MFLNREDNSDFTWINSDQTHEILLKIAVHSEDKLKKLILKFLLNNVDKKYDIYYKICLELMNSSKLPQ
jgi:hypothetical protein